MAQFQIRAITDCPNFRDLKAINLRLVSKSNPLPKNVQIACKTNSSQRGVLNALSWIKHNEYVIE